MDSDLDSAPLEHAEAKTAFRKPSNETATRNYRRRSPSSGSSSSDGHRSREHSASPSPPRRDDKKVHDQRKIGIGRDVDRDHQRNKYDRDGDSYRHSERLSSRSSHNHHRHEDYSSRDKYAEENKRTFSKSTRGERYSEDSRRETDRSRDSSHDVEKYSRDKGNDLGSRGIDKDREAYSPGYQKYKDKDSSFDRAGERDRYRRDGDRRDEKRDYYRSSKDRRKERSPSYDEPRVHRTDVPSRRDERSSRRDFKEADDPKYIKGEKEKYCDRETNRRKDRASGEKGERVDGGTTLTRSNLESSSKKAKLSGFSPSIDQDSKQPQELAGKVNAVQDCVKDSDIDAAKTAAIKAAELVNRNLVGTGFMSTDQKKKLLWGSKKSTAPEESTQRWNASLFSDRERQEKFNKLMGVKGEVKVEQKPDSPAQAEKQKELQLDLEKQYTAGLRRRDGRTVGLGL